MLTHLQITRELLGSCRQEIDRLLHNYWDNTEAKDDMPPLDYNWRHYQQLQEAGALLILTARIDGNLAGYVMYIIAEHPHHMGTVFATCDTLATDLEYRGFGVGSSLLKAAEAWFVGTDVKVILHGHRLCYSAKPLFPKHGYKLREQFYMKGL